MNAYLHVPYMRIHSFKSARRLSGLGSPLFFFRDFHRPQERTLLHVVYLCRIVDGEYIYWILQSLCPADG